MQLKFQAIFKNDDLNYSVGTVALQGYEEFAMRVVDPTHIIMTDPETWTPGTDPSALFGLTEEEYGWKDTNPEKLDELAQKMRTEIPSDRILAEQGAVRKKDRAASIDYGKYVRYRKENAEKRRNEAISRMLAAEELYCMYSGETNKPYVFQYSFFQMFEDKNVAMEAANEYRKRNIPILVSSFTHDQINSADAKSVFQELIVLGYPLVMFFDANQHQVMIQLKDIIKHNDYVGQKNNLVYGNPKLDFAITNLYQFLRTPKIVETSDPEKHKQRLVNMLNFMESRFIESLSDARFLVPTKTLPDGRVSPAVIKVPAQNLQAQKAPAAEEQSEQAEAPAAEDKSFLPVFTNGMEFVSDKDQYKAVVIPLDDLVKMVRETKLDGILINMRSKCAVPCGEERFAQVEKYRAWKAEHQGETQNEEIPDSMKDSEAAGVDAPADAPFVPTESQDKE